MEKKKRKLHHSAAVGAQRQTPARIFGKLTFPKHLQMSTTSFVCGGGKKQPVAALPTELNPPTGSGIGGVRGTHLCQSFIERGGDPRMGLILTDSLVRLRVSLLCGPDGGRGGGDPKIQKTLRCQDRSSMKGQCVSARQQKHQQETWFRATGRVWGGQFHPARLISCTHTHRRRSRSHINSIDGELYRHRSRKFGSWCLPEQSSPGTVAEMSDCVATTFSDQNNVRKEIKSSRNRQTS